MSTCTKVNLTDENYFFESNWLELQLSDFQIRCDPVQEAEVREWPTQGEPEDCLQGELQVRGPGEVPGKPGRHHAATSGGVLEVGSTINIIQQSTIIVGVFHISDRLLSVLYRSPFNKK